MSARKITRVVSSLAWAIPQYTWFSLRLRGTRPMKCVEHSRVFIPVYVPDTSKIFQIKISSGIQVACKISTVIISFGRELITNTSFLPRCMEGVKTLRTQDTSDPRHFGTIKLVPKCPDSSAPVPKCLCRSVSRTLRHWYRTVSTSSKHFCYHRPY